MLFRVGVLLVITGLTFGLLLTGTAVVVGFFCLLAGGLVLAVAVPNVVQSSRADTVHAAATTPTSMARRTSRSRSVAA